MVMIMIVVNTRLALTTCQALSGSLCSDKFAEGWRHWPHEPAILTAVGGPHTPAPADTAEAAGEIAVWKCGNAVEFL